MPLLTCNGIGVLRAEITMPRAGRWVARLGLTGDTAPTGSATVAGTGLSLAGYVERGGAWHRRIGTTIVGGTGGLANVVAPKFYRNAPARVIVSDLLSAVGETLSSTSDAGLLSTVLPAFARSGALASIALQLVVDEIGAGWRVLDDGTVWIGTDTWPTSTATYREIAADPSLGFLEVAPDDFGIRPGTVLADGTKVQQVIYRIEPSKIRCEVWS